MVSFIKKHLQAILKIFVVALIFLSWLDNKNATEDIEYQLEHEIINMTVRVESLESDAEQTQRQIEMLEAEIQGLVR
jgi:predicted ATP-grasp superfamily ATP-dependent carboligase